jgi:radical SAM protein with 4Fe4S-binding SPASM domain
MPRTAAIELTSRCNHKCFFCSCPWEAGRDKPINELDTLEWKLAMTHLWTYGVTHVSFTGGEPTLRSDLPQLISHAHDVGYTVGLVTNGHNMTNKMLEMCKRYNVLLSVSVPGIETFKENTGSDNLNAVLDIFTRSRLLGVKTVANIAVSKKNFYELYENISYPILKGADYILLNRFLPGGRGLQNTDLLLTNDEINQMLDIAEEILERSGLNGHVGTELPYCIIKTPDKYKKLQVASTCGAAKGFFVIDPEGCIKTCNHSPKRLCRWNELEKLEKDPYWQRFVNRTYYPKMCDGCKHTDICDGGCREAAHVYYGCPDDNDPCFDGIKTPNGLAYIKRNPIKNTAK